MEGLIRTPLKRIATPNGDVLHALKSRDAGFSGFGEAYFSMVLFDHVKGWKRHSRMTMNLIVPMGAIRFVVHDTRPESATKGTFYDVTLSPDSVDTYARLTVPPGVWMAFKGEGTPLNMLLNVASMEHDPLEAENTPLETFAWDWHCRADGLST